MHHLQDLRFIIADNRLSVRPVNSHRSHKLALIFLKQLQRLLRVLRPLHQIRWLHARAHIVEDIPQLVRRRRRRGHLQLELSALPLRVLEVVTCLVLCCGFGGDGRGLAENIVGAFGGGERGAVEEGYGVQRFGEAEDHIETSFDWRVDDVSGYVFCIVYCDVFEIGRAHV